MDNGIDVLIAEGIGMFKINFDPKKELKKKIINPEDLLPKRVETTDGKISAFNPQNIVESLIRETGLEQKRAIEITTNVLRRLSTLGLDFIAAPHLRELICGELTSQGLHEYRCQYTRLGIPIYDVREMLKEQSGSTFSSLITAQVIEQFVHLDRLSEDAQMVIDEITQYATKLELSERKLIMDSMENALRLYAEKKAKNII
ncbi:hypothetical protein NEF87_001764 [Candidatus Lokiarchaeum ossiferum]|uniref:ATP-cone domain-containing protein n=1 Tax=Candidatus Lokiarchaeum ossiferum TaxID=2951803 RepID=A0ABY6HSN3_9ARCH|nr:hypothetical protein NEF87_001764 [Candidatus Lokiarchaeum sp. B-35]